MKFLKVAVAKATIHFACWMLNTGQDLFDWATAVLMKNLSTFQILAFLFAKMESQGVDAQKYMTQLLNKTQTTPSPLPPPPLITPPPATNGMN